MLLKGLFSLFTDRVSRLKPGRGKPSFHEAESSDAIRVTVRPGETTLLFLAVCFTIPTVLFAAALDVELKMLVALGAIFLVNSYLFWITLSVNIEVSNDEVYIRYLHHSFRDKVSNLMPEASPKFDFKSDENLSLKKLYSGTRLLGFAVGWFTLKDDRVAFTCLTRKKRARFFSSKDGYLLILDPSVASKIEPFMKGETYQAQA